MHVVESGLTECSHWRKSQTAAISGVTYLHDTPDTFQVD